MAHQIAEIAGKNAIAYSSEYGTPWHTLGTKVDGLSTVEDILREASADYEVVAVPVSAQVEMKQTNGDTYTLTQQIHDRVCIGRYEEEYGRTTKFVPFEVRSDKYTILQNETAARLALAVASLDDDAKCVDVAGVLGEGERFFAYIPLGDIEIDALGVKDTLGLGMGVFTSHDGTSPLTIARSATRWVCNNTVSAGLSRAAREGNTWKVNHRKFLGEATMDELVETASSALGFVRDEKAIDGMRTRIHTLLALDGFKVNGKDLNPEEMLTLMVDSIFVGGRKEWGKLTDLQKENHAMRRSEMRARFQSERNAGGYGENAWSIWNTLVEWEDHADRKGASAKSRAMSAISDTSAGTKRKMTAMKILEDQVALQGV